MLKKSSKKTAGPTNSTRPKEKAINLTKRDKLKNIILSKFMKKYGIQNPEIFLDEEISKFLQCQNISNADMKKAKKKKLKK